MATFTPDQIRSEARTKGCSLHEAHRRLRRREIYDQLVELYRQREMYHEIPQEQFQAQVIDVLFKLQSMQQGK